MNYTQDAVVNQLEELIYGDDKQTNQHIHTIKTVMILFLVIVVIALFATGVGMIVGVLDNTPDVDSLSFSPTGYATTTYNTKGELVATLVQEGSNRQEATFDEFPDDLINAFVAIEDQRFWEHNGIDLRAISRAIVGIIRGDDSAGGGSTITQQLIKNNVFGGGNETGFLLYERKFQEWYLALRLENQPDRDKREVKEEILTNYLNTINLGNNTLGVKVAAQRYFGKELQDLTLEECSVLAAITKNPTRLNPITHPEENQKRRLTVLQNMYEQGYITEDQMNQASSMDIYDQIDLHDTVVTSSNEVYSYFTDALVEEVQLALREKLGLTAAEARNMLYSGGLRIMTTQDPDIQAIVDAEVNNPDNYDTAKYSFKWACTIEHANGVTRNYSETDVENYFVETLGDTSYDGLFASEEAVNTAIDQYLATVYDEAAGDNITAETLDTTLQPQVSFVLMDQYTKEVKAISGGRGEKKYSLTINRAYNTYKQPGSVFKVVSSFAPAIDECGATLGTCYYDCEYTLGDKTFRNWWSSGRYFGYSSIRDGIEFSMNIVAVRCMNETVTPEFGVEYAKRLGITSLTDEDVSAVTALGGITKGVTNLELTNAFATISGGGQFTKAKFFTKIYDHNGDILIDMDEEEPEQVMKETTAFLLTDALRRATEYHTKWASSFTVNNTSSRAHLDNMTTAGKSGTTTNNNDVWFVGFTPYYTAGIWGGCDDNQSLSDSETGEYNGGTSFHKDIWKKIMTQVHELKGLQDKAFDIPEGIVQVEVCRKSGKLPTSGCRADYRSGSNAVYTEYFDVDNVPTETCDHHTSSGRIIPPDEDAGKYTDDHRWRSSGSSSAVTTVPQETSAVVPGITTGPAEIVTGPGESSAAAETPAAETPAETAAVPSDQGGDSSGDSGGGEIFAPGVVAPGST